VQYVRLSFDTSPEMVLRVLQEHWGLQLPKLVISVHGGIAKLCAAAQVEAHLPQGSAEGCEDSWSVDHHCGH
jgi:transient receptor potential cation channel subfamily M protein 3